MGWTVEMIDELKQLWAQGMTTGEIGKKLGVSKNSVVGKVHRLGLSGRPSPIKKKDNDEKPAAAPKTKPEKTTEKPAPKEKAPSPAAAPAAKPASETPAPAPKVSAQPTVSPVKNGKTTLTDLDNHTCRWPIGDPKDENFHFCGRKVKIGQTYCEEHANIAYVKALKK